MKKRFVIGCIVLAIVTPIAALVRVFWHDPVWLSPATFVLAMALTFYLAMTMLKEEDE